MAKSNSPLSGTKRKKRSYLGNLDDLMADVSDEDSEAPQEPEAEAPTETDEPAKPPKEEEPAPKKHLNLKIDETLHTRFKGIVGMQGRTMTDVLEELMREYVRESASKLDL